MLGPVAGDCMSVSLHWETSDSVWPVATVTGDVIGNISVDVTDVTSNVVPICTLVEVAVHTVRVAAAESTIPSTDSWLATIDIVPLLILQHNRLHTIQLSNLCLIVFLCLCPPIGERGIYMPVTYAISVSVCPWICPVSMAEA